MPKYDRLLKIESRNLDLSITKQCDLLGVSRTLYYYKPVSQSAENLEIARVLIEKYKTVPFYGALKLTEDLSRIGYKINVKRTRRLMKMVLWKTIYREPKTTFMNKEHKKYPYLLRDLKIVKNNQVWCTDISYIPMRKGFMYLSAIMDVHSRCILNWSLSNSMTAEWCSELLQETIEIYGAPEIFNSDQGTQYTSDVHIGVLKKHAIQISMDGKGRAIDNIYIERFWRSIKYENIYLNVYENGNALFKGLETYFNFYNNERYHQSLDFKTPNEVFYKLVKVA
jgi:putative transposase